MTSMPDGASAPRAVDPRLIPTPKSSVPARATRSRYDWRPEAGEASTSKLYLPPPSRPGGKDMFRPQPRLTTVFRVRRLARAQGLELNAIRYVVPRRSRTD